MNLVLKPVPFDFKVVGNFFNEEIEKNKQDFSQNMEELIASITEAAQGRIPCEEFNNPDLLNGLIDECYDIYESNRGNKASALVNSRVFKILSGKNNQHTDETREFLAAKTRRQMKYAFQLSNEIRNQKDVRAFFYGIMENIASPESIQLQISAFQDVDKSYVEIFNKKHAKLQGRVFSEMVKLPKNQMQMITEQIKEPGKIFEFNQEPVENVQKFVNALEELISKGDNYAPLFRERLIPGLVTVYNKYSPENPIGTSVLTWK